MRWTFDLTPNKLRTTSPIVITNNIILLPLPVYGSYSLTTRPWVSDRLCHNIHGSC